MPRDVIRPGTTDIGLNTTRRESSSQSRHASTKVLTTPRSRAYLEAMRKLDAQTTLTAAELEGIISTIHREFDEKWAARPIGLMAHCYLGHPFETHALAMDGRIVEHYKPSDNMPMEYERAKLHAKGETYAFIEVYLNKLICVREDGTTVTIEG